METLKNLPIIQEISLWNNQCLKQNFNGKACPGKNQPLDYTTPNKSSLEQQAMGLITLRTEKPAIKWLFRNGQTNLDVTNATEG